MKKPNVMLDLETWGVGHCPVIVSIGACVFGGAQVSQPFKVNVSPDGQKANIEAATVRWWMEQERAAIDAFMSDPRDIRHALRMFSEWLPPGAQVWGNGSNFDNRILREAYEAEGMTVPWHYRDDRDLRTLFALFGRPKIERQGTHHDALADAIYQARCAMEIFHGF